MSVRHGYFVLYWNSYANEWMMRGDYDGHKKVPFATKSAAQIEQRKMYNWKPNKIVKV